jgi:hypothetical protein
MCTASRNTRNGCRKDRDLSDLASCVGVGVSAGPPQEGGLTSLLEFQGGLRTRCAPHSRAPLPGVCDARRLAGRMVVCELDVLSPYDEEALEDAFAEVGASR